jgi:hypothetical protein
MESAAANSTVQMSPQSVSILGVVGICWWPSNQPLGNTNLKIRPPGVGSVFRAQGTDAGCPEVSIVYKYSTEVLHTYILITCTYNNICGGSDSGRSVLEA